MTKTIPTGMVKTSKVSHWASLLLLSWCLLPLTPALPAQAQGDSAAMTTATSPVNWTELITYTTTRPRPFRGTDGKYNLVYELVITNYTGNSITLKEIAVADSLDRKKIIHSLTGEALKAAILSPAKTPALTLKGAETKIVFLNIESDKPDFPAALAHHIQYQSPKLGSKSKTPVNKTLVTPPTSLHPDKAVVISPPLRGKGWLAIGGYASSIGHRRALFPIDNKLQLSQRYAIDWLQVSEDNYTTKAPVDKLENATCFLKPVFAVAPGTVVGVVNRYDSQPENKPSGDLEYPGGNTITIKHEDGNYSFYAHLLKDSIKVKEGDRVTPGQHIATLGNSGNTTGPHLHFHITSGPGTLGADGIPYVFDQFELSGNVSSMEDCLKSDSQGKPIGIVKTGKEGTHKEELVKEGAIVDFAPAP
ncbi:MAG: M23 family metallopeptidase [Candidatus Obscuribacter sp.]|nr:M23 family metallopeptidase [Candidatus Obscuribacter sp.]MBK9277231.1 M23 family metallopeptidase [Candidatus Obscuribacter sp.]